MSEIQYTGVHDIEAVVDYFMANDKLLINNPVFAEGRNVNVLKESLTDVVSKIENEKQFEQTLNYKYLIFLQLIHYCDTIEKAEELKADLQELLVHRIYLGTEINILTWIFRQQYGRDPDLSNPENNTPQGFLRYLKLNCKPDVVRHFIGLALEQFIRTKYPDDPFYKDAELFTGSYSYLCDFVMEADKPEKVAETIREQQEEMKRLFDEMVETGKEVGAHPENLLLQDKQNKVIKNFMTEKLEMEFMNDVILRLF